MSSFTQLDSGGTGNHQLRIALLDSVTHDFRSPLTSIKAAVTALLANSRVKPSQRHKLLSIINEEAERLNKLVGNAVEASRLDAHVKLDLELHTIAAIRRFRKRGLQNSSHQPIAVGSISARITVCAG